MAEESAMSTAESGMSGVDPGAPVGAPGGAGAVQAEMITKKLANYWCIIGSIPLVLFLLVALPTIFYVKKFSEYVNADYCDTKSCKELADVILKMGDTSDACKGFSTHVCKAKTDYTIQTLQKIIKDIKSIKNLDPSWKGVGSFTNVQNFIGSSADFQDVVDLQVPGDTLGGALDYDGVLDTALLNGGLAIRGIDGLVRAVHIIGNTSGNQGSGSMLELGAPIEDMYPHMVLDMGKLDLKSAILLMRVDDDAKMQKLQDFITSFNQFVVSNTLNTRQHMSRLVTVAELKSNYSGKGWNWGNFFTPFENIQVDYVSDTSLVRLAHPQFILGLNKFLEDWLAKNAITLIMANCMVQALARVATIGHFSFKDFKGNKAAGQVMQTERVFPAGLDHLLVYVRSKQYGAANGINPGGTNASAMMNFLAQDVRNMLDSMAFSFSLSQSVTEENRVHFYRRLKHMKVSPGFFNDTDGISDAHLTPWESRIVGGDEGPDPYGAPIQARFAYEDHYWKAKDATYLKFRNPYSPLYATYTPTEDHLFVPMGVYTPPVFRNSQKNRIFTAASAYLVMVGVMKALTMSGSMVVNGQQVGENWVGYSWSRKMEKYALCLSTERKDNTSILPAMDIHYHAAVIPAYRYFKRMVLEKAFPRPEFRIDWISDLSSTQLFFYNWALLHCGTTFGKELIDIAARNSWYFRESFNCEPGTPMYKAKNPCDLWNTTRREY